MSGVFNYDSKYRGATAKHAHTLKQDQDLSGGGFSVNHARVLVGSGLETFEKGKTALQNWRHFNLNWAFVDSKTLIQSGVKFCVCAKEIFPWLVMPLEVAYVDESRNSENAVASFKFGSGTLQGHLLLPTSELNRNAPTWSKTIILNIHDFGAKGDGLSDDTKTLLDVWKKACSLSSPAKIVIPSRKAYLVKPIDFAGPCQSNVTLRISGTIVAPQDPKAWDGLNEHKWLYFHGVNHLIVEGDGTIDGRGHQWWARSCKTNESNPCTHAPTAITFHRCNNLKVRDVTLYNSQKMHMAFTNCLHVAASGLRVIAPSDSPNTDGIHISASTHVELKDSTVGTGDDCISIVSNSSRIRIKNIICGPGHGISIGSLGKYNSYDAVQDVVIDGARLFNTENGVRIKTWQGGSGFARKITFENIWMQNVSNPIIIDQYYCDSPVACANQTSAVIIDRISFRSIKGTSATEEAVILSCSESYPCTRLYLENVQLVSFSGITESFCWEAYGTFSGLIYPPSCISPDGNYQSEQR